LYCVWDSAQSTSEFGFPCGGETANYWDSLETVTQADSTILQQLTIEEMPTR
jgi:hypothetical protein